jgi:phosphate transport system protein
MEIDDMCHTALARHQPTAVDLRFLVAAMKIDNDLERIGDSAVNIAEAALVLNMEPPLKPYIDLPRLSELTQKMVRESLDAFVQGNVQLALDICSRDDQVDGLYKQLFRELPLRSRISDGERAPISCHIARNLGASLITPPMWLRT